MKYFFLLFFSFLLNVSLSAQWTQVASLPNNFTTDHSFGFAINDVGYLVTGNTTSGASDDFYRYSAEDDEWEQLSDFPGGARGFAIGDVWNNKAYLGFGSGGTQGVRNDLWEFNPVIGVWTELASCPCVPRLHPAFVTHQGNIYVGLGNAAGQGNFGDWWQYNIATDTWTQKADFPSHDRHHPYQFAVGDYVYTGFGHGSVAPGIYEAWYRYDPSDDTWMEVASIPDQGRVAGTQFSHDGMGYVLSGDGENHNSMFSGEFWQYDPVFDSWLELEAHPGNSRWAPASFIIEDEVYLINGSSFGINQSAVYKFPLGDPPVSVADQEAEINLEIFPNPFSNEVTVNFDSNKLKDGKLIVYDVLGKVVFESVLDLNFSNTQNFEQLNQGIYLFEIYSGETRITTKRVVKNGLGR